MDLASIYNDGRNHKGENLANPTPATLDSIFSYHAPKDGQPERYVALRDKAKELAILILETTPPSREQSVALTNVQQAVMWANAAIAINE